MELREIGYWKTCEEEARPNAQDFVDEEWCMTNAAAQEALITYLHHGPAKWVE